METPNISVLEATATPFHCTKCGWKGTSGEIQQGARGLLRGYPCPGCGLEDGLFMGGPLKLNLGCSDAHKAGWTNVDIVPPCDVQVDLTQRWPWPDSSVDEIVAWDIFEHLPDIIHTMNEAHRVLKSFGILNLVVPTTEGRGAWQDPTHKSFWNPNSLFYFVQDYPEWERFHRAYGISAQFVRRGPVDHKQYPGNVWKMHVLLTAVKA